MSSGVSTGVAVSPDSGEHWAAEGAWAVPVARELLDRCLRSIGSGFGDIRRFLVTHIHRDHFTMATVLGHELGAYVALGIDEKAGLDLFHSALDEDSENPFIRLLVVAGAADIAELWEQGRDPGL